MPKTKTYRGWLVGVVLAGVLLMLHSPVTSVAQDQDPSPQDQVAQDQGAQDQDQGDKRGNQHHADREGQVRRQRPWHLRLPGRRVVATALRSS